MDKEKAKLSLDERLNKLKNELQKKEAIIQQLQDEFGKIYIDAKKVVDLNDKIAESEEYLKRLNASKDKFFSIIAHDLKNPLHGLMMTSEFLINHRDKLSEDEVHEEHKNMNKYSKNITDLLENLLQWARSQSNRIIHAPEDINLYLLVKNNINVLFNLANKKNIDISNKVSQNLFAFADENMINTVIRNLLTNAIKYTDDFGEISISAEEYKNFVKIGVHDNGIGLTKEDAEKLFRIDEKVSIIGDPDKRGTGLGLILCKEFIDKNTKILNDHGQVNNIWVESEYEKGSSFYFILPINPNT